MSINEQGRKLRRNLSLGIPPGVRYGLSISFVVLSIVFVGLAAHFMSTPITTKDDLVEASKDWVKLSCQNRLKEAGYPVRLGKDNVTAWLKSDGSVSKDAFMQAEIAILKCPGMEMTNLCVGQCDAGELITLTPQEK